MIINLQGGSFPKARVEYLLYGTKGDRDPKAVDILDGNADLFVELAEKNPYKTKTYNYLISFAESKEELERKLEKQGKTIKELYEEIISFLLPAEYYPRESLNILAVGHADTDNYHIHLTIENYDYYNHKSLYIPKTRTEVEFYRALERYIKVKYNLTFGKSNLMDKGKSGVEKVKEILRREGRYKEKTRDEIKEELTNYLTQLIQSGEIETREDLIAFLSSIDGVKINRIGKRYISIKVEGEKKPLRLKGGIYDEQRFTELKEYIRDDKRKIPSLTEARELLEEVRRNREKNISKRRQKYNLERLESFDLECDREFSISNAQEHKNAPVDRFFPLDWTSVIYSVLSPQKPGQFFSSLRDDDRREWAEVERVQTAEKNTMPRYARKVDRLSVGSNSFTAVKFKELMKMRKSVNEIRKLELEYLKNLDPEVVLSALGISDWQEKNGYLLMKSPIREDNNPSFEVFYGTERQCWVYMDFGTGWRGTSIDLWQAVRRVDYVTAVREMREAFGINLLEERDLNELKIKINEKIQFEQRRQAEKRKRLAKKERDESKKAVHRILEVKNPSHPALLKYLKDRGIVEIPEWLKEIHYLYLPEKKYYFALAVQDQNGVWHARNPYGKVNIITSPDQKPTYTLIRETKRKNRTVVIVEGVFDALTLCQKFERDFDIVILNSVTNTDRLIESGILQQYKDVILALDSDEAGQKAEKKLYEYLKQSDDIKIRKIKCSEGKDINECYIKKGKMKVENITPKRFWIGKVQEGMEGSNPVYRAVVSDRKEVLKKLGARNIKRINSAEDISRYWVQEQCRGFVELYLSENIAEKWIYEGFESENTVWTGVKKYSFSPSRTVEYRPTQIRHRKYFKIGKNIVLDIEIEREPYKYAECENTEVRELAKEIITEIERERKIEELQREQERNYGTPEL